MIKEDCTREEAEKLVAKGGRILGFRTEHDEQFVTVEYGDDMGAASEPAPGGKTHGQLAFEAEQEAAAKAKSAKPAKKEAAAK